MDELLNKQSRNRHLISVHNTFGNQTISDQNRSLSGHRSNSPFYTNNSTAELPTSHQYQTKETSQATNPNNNNSNNNSNNNYNSNNYNSNNQHTKTPQLNNKSKFTLNLPSNSGQKQPPTSTHFPYSTLPYLNAPSIGSNNNISTPYKQGGGGTSLGNTLSEAMMAQKLSEVETALARERARNSILEREREINALQEGSSDKKGGFMTSREEFSRLTNLIQEKDLHILNLMNEMGQRPSKESMEAQRNNFQKSFTVLQNTINEMENQLVMVMTENERLCRKLEEKDREFRQRYDSMSFESTSLAFGYEDQIKDLTAKLDRLIVENQKISLINDTYAQKVQETQEISFINERRSLEQKDEIIRKAIVNFQNEQKEIRERHDLEMMQLDNRIKFMKESVEDSQTKIHCYLSEIENLRKQQIHFEVEIQEERRRNNLFEQKLIDFEDLSQQLNQSYQRITQLELKINVLISENERVSNIAQFRASELSNLKKLHDSESHQNNQKIQDLKSHYESTYRTISEAEQSRYEQNFQFLNEEKFKLNEKYSTLISNHESQTRELNLTQMKLEDSIKQLVDTKKKYEDLAIENAQIQKEFNEDQNSLISRIADLEKNTEKLLTDNKNLNHLLTQRIEEVSVLSEQLNETDDTYSKMTSELKKSHQQAFKNLDERYTAEISRLRNLHTEQMSHYASQVGDQEKVIDHLIHEKDQLNEINYQVRADVELLQMEMKRLESEVELQKYILEKLELDNEQLKIDRAQADNIAVDHKSRVLELEREVEIIRKMSNDQQNEISDLRSVLEHTEDDNSQKRSQLNQLLDRINLLVADNQAMKREISDLDNIINFDKQEFEKLGKDQESLIEVFDLERKQNDAYNKSLNETVTHLKMEVDQHSIKIAELRSVLQSREKEISDLKLILEHEKQQSEKDTYDLQRLFDEYQNVDREKKKLQFELETLNNKHRLETNTKDTAIRNYQDELDRVKQQSIIQIDNFTLKINQIEKNHSQQIGEYKKNIERLMQQEGDKNHNQIAALINQHNEQIGNYQRSHDLMFEEVEALKEINMKQREDSDNMFLRIRELEQQLLIKMDLERAYVTDIELRKNSYDNLFREFTQIQEHNTNIIRDMELWKLQSKEIDPSHPMVVDLQNEIENLRNQLYHLKVEDLNRDQIHHRHFSPPVYRPPQHLSMVRHGPVPTTQSRSQRNPSGDYGKRNHSYSIDQHPVNQTHFTSNNPDLSNLINENENLNRAILNRCQNIAHQNYF